MKSRHRQKGAALLIVITLFLIVVLVPLLAIFGRTLQNDTFSGSYLWRAQARDAANGAMTTLRTNVAKSIGTGGLLEYQPSPPSWFVQNVQNVQPASASFWAGCQAGGLCQATTVTLANGTGRQQFQVLELVTPTGVVDTTLCNTEGYVAVFYNLWVQATASKNPAAGSVTTQAVYRACVLQG